MNQVLVPLVLPLFYALLNSLFGLLGRKISRSEDLIAVFVLLAIALFAQTSLFNVGPQVLWSGQWVYDDLSKGASLFLGGLSLCSIFFLKHASALARDRDEAAFFSFILLAVAWFVVSCQNILLFCVAMEIGLWCCLGLAGLRRQTRSVRHSVFSQHALHSVGSIFILLGAYFVYRATGTLNLEQGVAQFGRDLAGKGSMHYSVAMSLMILGFIMKLGLGPFFKSQMEITTSPIAFISLMQTFFLKIPAVIFAIRFFAVAVLDEKLRLLMLILVGASMLLSIGHSLLHNSFEKSLFFSWNSVFAWVLMPFCVEAPVHVKAPIALHAIVIFALGFLFCLFLAHYGHRRWGLSPDMASLHAHPRTPFWAGGMVLLTFFFMGLPFSGSGALLFELIHLTLKFKATFVLSFVLAGWFLYALFAMRLVYFVSGPSNNQNKSTVQWKRQEVLVLILFIAGAIGVSIYTQDLLKWFEFFSPRG